MRLVGLRNYLALVVYWLSVRCFTNLLINRNMARIVFEIATLPANDGNSVSNIDFRPVTPQEFDKEVIDLPLDHVLVVRQKIV